MTIPNLEDDDDIPAPMDDLALYDLALSIVAAREWISTPRLQRMLLGIYPGATIGWNQCDRLLSRMEATGLVGPIDSENRNHRDVLVHRR